MRIETQSDEPGRERRKLVFECPRYAHRLAEWAEDKLANPNAPEPLKECHVLLKPWPINAPTWEWNGSEAAPTVSPSIQCDDCGWHGFIKDGKFSNA